MQRFYLPSRGTAWRTSRGQMGLWSPVPSLLVVALQGYGEADFGPLIMKELEQAERANRLHMFFDVGKLTSYDSRLRTELTAAFLRKRPHIASFSLFVDSKLVSMGVAVANLALGGMITTHESRKSFNASLDEKCAELHVSDFSSQALSGITAPPAA